MKINMEFLPIKAHYFFFMASMGPILPQLSVYGKQLGVSPMLMGSVTGVLPILFLLAKPAFGFVVDRFRKFRKHIFVALIIGMGVMYSGFYFIPDNNIRLVGGNCHQAIQQSCNVSNINEKLLCEPVRCSFTTVEDEYNETYLALPLNNNKDICFLSNIHVSQILQNSSCDLQCHDEEMTLECAITSVRFWIFVFLMCVGTIGFNVSNSISDAICFDVLGEGQQMEYGKQRVWGTIGFGISALISGYIVDQWSESNVKSFTPALIIMLIFLLIDVLCCKKLQLPPMETPKNIMRDILDLLKLAHIRIFIIFAALQGLVDSFFIYFFFWYLEELAAETGHTYHIKLLEGIIVASETLGGEILFFSISGSILRVIGYGHSLSMVFACYALRLGLISVAPSPWWIVPIEFFLQGPTYAMGYTTIVAYASAVSPAGASATMQGLVAGVDDGFGYAIGSVLSGILYRRLGGRGALNVFTALALGCSILHTVLYVTVLKNKIPSTKKADNVEYKTPNDAVKQTEHYN